MTRKPSLPFAFLGTVLALFEDSVSSVWRPGLSSHQWCFDTALSLCLNQLSTQDGVVGQEEDGLDLAPLAFSHTAAYSCPVFEADLPAPKSYLGTVSKLMNRSVVF